MGLFDIHAHLTSPRLCEHTAEILARAREAGVTTIVSNGLNPEDNQAVLDLSSGSDMVQPALGLYPVDAVLPEMLELGVDYPRDSEVHPEDAIEWVRDHVEQAVAVGEVGLDHYWVPDTLWELQEQRFRKLVSIALEADKPLIVHTRKAERRTFEVLVEMGVRKVNWHCYSSKLKLAKQIAAEGHYLSIPANVVRSQSFARIAMELPRESLLLETDCPYLAPEPGGESEPAHVLGSITFMAKQWGCSVESAQTQLEANFERLMGFAP